MARRIGEENARNVLAIYYIPRMGHGGNEYDAVLSAQIDTLERWIDYRTSGGKKGSPPPKSIGPYLRDTESRAAN